MASTLSTPSISTPRSVATASDSGHGRVIVVSNDTPTRPAKRLRKGQPETPRRMSARLAGSSVTPKSTPKSLGSSQRGSKMLRRRVDEGDDNDEPSDTSSSNEDEDVVASVTKKAPVESGKGFIRRNAFDEYFAAASKPSRTSNNVFSQLVSPLSPDEHAALLPSTDAASPFIPKLEQVHKAHEALFPRYALELSEGLNLLFFGFGSKRTLLNTFARDVCAPRGHVAIINAFQPHVGLRQLLACIEQVPGLANVPLTRTAPEAQVRRIYDFFLPVAAIPGNRTASRPLFLLIHNIDAPAMRTPRARAALSLLAMSPRIHLIASIDHVHAQTLWSTAEASTRKHVYSEGSGTTLPPTRGFAWVWHDMTTMRHYDAELAHVDVTRLIGKPGKTAANVVEQGMTETAAQHILASVNTKAKKLFALLARTQLASIEESGQPVGNTHVVPYTALFNAARADFIATNDTTFKALLAEFRDHKLITSSSGKAGEMLGIPLGAEDIRRLLERLSAES